MVNGRWYTSIFDGLVSFWSHPCWIAQSGTGSTLWDCVPMILLLLLWHFSPQNLFRVPRVLKSWQCLDSVLLTMERGVVDNLLKYHKNRNPIYQLEKIISVLHQNELDIQNLILPCIPQKLGYINVFSSTTLTFTDGLVFDNVLIMMFSFEW